MEFPVIPALLLLATLLLGQGLAGEECMNVDVVAERVRAEFDEMPGMTLTLPQASRLFGLEEGICLKIVDRLVRSAYLRWTQNGAVTRTRTTR